MSEKEFPETKEVYLYDKDTGEFISQYHAQLSPLDAPGTYLCPVYHTEKKPPQITSDEVAVFRADAVPTEGVWLVMKDLRGKTIYHQIDNSTKEITSIGNIPQDYDLKPSISFQVEKAAAAMLLSITAWRDAARYADVITTVGKKKIAWQVDPVSAGLVEGAINMVGQGVILCPTSWRSSANDDIEITIDDLKNIASIAAVQTQTAYQRSWELKAELAAAVKANDLDAIQNLTW